MSEQQPVSRTSGPVAIVIVDDHAMFRRGVRAELESAGRALVRVLAEAADVDEAVAAVSTHHPDVVLLDVHLPGGGGAEVMRRVTASHASPDTRYLALSVSDAAEDVIGTIRGGARGYAHIGVIDALRARDYEIVGIAGSSMGALVGGLEAAGRRDEFADWAKSLTQRTILRLLDFSISAAGKVSRVLFSACQSAWVLILDQSMGGSPSHT